jgi:hypothetical protein
VFSAIATDADSGDFSIPFRITVAASAPPPPGGNGGHGGSGGSGGGGTDPITFCLFGTVLVWRSLRRRAKERTHSGRWTSHAWIASSLRSSQ